MTTSATVKRAFDVVVAGLALFVLIPVLGVVAWQVRRRLGSPVLFRQVRPGLHGEPFELVKFRTMLDAVDESGASLSDGERLTDFGRFLRASSLDEIPELWNVVKGEMSLVGPRPLLVEYLPLYSSAQARRHAVRPGLTGWAQIHGRNLLSWEEKFALDLWYVDNQSFWLDMRILAATIVQVCRRHGISAESHPTMTRFTGPEDKS